SSGDESAIGYALSEELPSQVDQRCIDGGEPRAKAFTRDADVVQRAGYSEILVAAAGRWGEKVNRPVEESRVHDRVLSAYLDCGLEGPARDQGAGIERGMVHVRLPGAGVFAGGAAVKDGLRRREAKLHPGQAGRDTDRPRIRRLAGKR